MNVDVDVDVAIGKVISSHHTHILLDAIPWSYMNECNWKRVSVAAKYKRWAFVSVRLANKCTLYVTFVRVQSAKSTSAKIRLECMPVLMSDVRM